MVIFYCCLRWIIIAEPYHANDQLMSGREDIYSTILNAFIVFRALIDDDVSVVFLADSPTPNLITRGGCGEVQNKYAHMILHTCKIEHTVVKPHCGFTLGQQLMIHLMGSPPHCPRLPLCRRPSQLIGYHPHPGLLIPHTRHQLSKLSSMF